jgi:hypothetical protein
LGVAVVSATDIWAVGEYAVSSSTNQTLIEHWNGSNWQIVPSPNVAGSVFNDLNGVAVVSTNDVWAVGFSNGTLIEHWNGSNWQVVASPNVGSVFNDLNGVAVVSANDVWAAGDFSPSSGPSQTLIEHWNGTRWKVISSPNAGFFTNFLDGVATVSANDVWAVGGHANKTLTEQWNGTS